MPSNGSWKDHPIEEFLGDKLTDTTFRTPTRAQYELWLDAVRKSLGALGQEWMTLMALDLEYVRGKYEHLIGNGHPDNPDGPIFQYVVVSLAITAGALYCLPKPRHPLDDVRHCAKNYR